MRDSKAANGSADSSFFCSGSFVALFVRAPKPTNGSGDAAVAIGLPNAPEFVRDDAVAAPKAPNALGACVVADEDRLPDAAGDPKASNADGAGVDAAPNASNADAGAGAELNDPNPGEDGATGCKGAAEPKAPKFALGDDTAADPKASNEERLPVLAADASPNASNEERLPVFADASPNASKDERLGVAAVVGDPNASNGVAPVWLFVFFAATGESAKPNGSLGRGGLLGGLKARKSFAAFAGADGTETGAGVAAPNPPKSAPGGGASVKDPVLNSSRSGGAAAGLAVNPPKSPKVADGLELLVELLKPPKSSKSFCCFLG